MTRLDLLRHELEKSDLDAVIIFNELNQFYITKIAFTDGFVFVTRNSAHIVTDFRYIEMAQKNAGSDFEVVMPSNRIEYIKKIISDENVKTVGFEGDFVSYQSYCDYKAKLSEVELLDVKEMFSSMRMIKDASEIEKMQKAQDITDKAFSAILKKITPEMTELDVAVELEYEMRKNGADGFAFETIAVSGDASSLPHGTPRPIKLRPGFLTMDFGAKLDGYCSDMTRTIVIGKADADIKHLYNTVLKAQLAALDYLREGADCGEADKVARDIIDSYPEFNGCFGHSLGHSIGLYVHESPGLNKKGFGNKLRRGQVTSVEPGIYLFGKYGCRIEDMVVIEKDGIHNFTHSTKELIEIY